MTSEIYSSSDFSDSDFLREILRHTTTSVGLVTSAWNGKENIMACEWAIQVGYSPPLFLLVIGKGKATAEFILNSREFGLTFASDQQATQSHVAGSYSRHTVDKLAKGLFETRPGITINAPVLTGGLLAVECKVVKIVDLEGRYLFIGEAMHAEMRDDKSPIIYHSGQYFSLGDQLPKSK